MSARLTTRLLGFCVLCLRQWWWRRRCGTAGLLFGFFALGFFLYPKLLGVRRQFLLLSLSLLPLPLDLLCTGYCLFLSL